MEEFITTYCKSIPDGKNIMMICMKQKLCNGKKKLLKEAESCKVAVCIQCSGEV